MLMNKSALPSSPWTQGCPVSTTHMYVNHILLWGLQKIKKAVLSIADVAMKTRKVLQKLGKFVNFITNWGIGGVVLFPLHHHLPVTSPPFPLPFPWHNMHFQGIYSVFQPLLLPEDLLTLM